MPITKHRLTIEALNSTEPNQLMDAHALAIMIEHLIFKYCVEFVIAPNQKSEFCVHLWVV
jgi:hypothetical protein